MKSIIIGILSCLFFTGALFAQNPPTNMDSVSYALGVVLSGNLKQQGFNQLNGSELAKGFEDAMRDTATLDAASANAIIQNYLRDQQEEASKEQRKDGEDFLAEVAKRSEITVTESGLAYEVLKEGSGKSPVATETVEVHYHGTLIDGTVFDSSVERGQTIEFPLNRVIPGWTEGLQLMKEGAKYRFYIPYDLAYGAQGSAPKIPPYSALIL